MKFAAIQAYEALAMNFDRVMKIIIGPDEQARFSCNHCRTPEDVREFANRIRHSHPSYADDLIATANRAEGIE